MAQQCEDATSIAALLPVPSPAGGAVTEKVTLPFVLTNH